jgi:hypothetical protein
MASPDRIASLGDAGRLARTADVVIEVARAEIVDEALLARFHRPLALHTLVSAVHVMSIEPPLGGQRPRRASIRGQR